MAYSMTGYASVRQALAHTQTVIQLRSINHRYFDLSMQCPPLSPKGEFALRKYLRDRLQRGKVHIQIQVENEHEQIWELDTEYCQSLEQAHEMLSRKFTLRPLDWTDVLQSGALLKRYEQIVSEAWESDLMEAVNVAITQLISVRKAEGDFLAQDLLSKCADIHANVTEIEHRYPKVQQTYEQKLCERASRIATGQLDEEFPAMAVAFLMEKCCVDEEIQRLRSHVVQMSELLRQDAPIGRRLDFILQECNREANTILSKSTDTYVTNQGIALKSILEQIREQVQNLL